MRNAKPGSHLNSDTVDKISTSGEYANILQIGRDGVRAMIFETGRIHLFSNVLVVVTLVVA